MYQCQKIRREIDMSEKGNSIRKFLRYSGYREHYREPVTLAKAYALEKLFTQCPKNIYDADLIAGSLKGMYSGPLTPGELEQADEICSFYEHHSFINNFDHFAGDYAAFLKEGISGTLGRISSSKKNYSGDPSKQLFLTAAEITMQAFSRMCLQYAEAANTKGKSAMAACCRKISSAPPESFQEALQLLWLVYQAFLYEGRYAMAFGRMDQYLYPYYRTDIENRTMSHEECVELLAGAFIKINERTHFQGGDDVVNICIGGVDTEGKDVTNELSYAILEAVKRANIPGPNLSARIHKNTPKEFVEACLEVIGTGLGYPALMNDEVNIPALLRSGYAIEHVREYCMVGCIENFLPGLQPPWTDGRFNAPKYLEAVLNNGCCTLTGKPVGLETEFAQLSAMDKFMEEFRKQLEFGAMEYMAKFRLQNRLFNPDFMEQPFLSCFAHECIERGLDINSGGTLYPSVHGVACMGIATIADSLAAIEELVFNRKKYTLKQISQGLKNNFDGFEAMQRDMLQVAKYGNNEDLPDKYAVWYIDTMYEIFKSYRTHDNGDIYIAVAANTQNISSGKITGATPDGRKARMPLNDAASPTYGMDRKGPTAVALSCVKPDYTKAACGTVLNQKFSPSFFETPDKREKLYHLIRTYFDLGGQELQVNALSRKILEEAMKNPEDHKNLVVRVSGFSAFFTALERPVQEDILARTEHE